MEVNLYEKIYGSLIGAAIGDALAAPTELRSHNQIKVFFQGEVREFKTPPNDNNSKGRLKGQITDAFGIPYTILYYLSENDVKLDKETALNGLIEWGKDEELLERFAGLTTKKVINKLESRVRGVILGATHFFRKVGNKYQEGTKNYSLEEEICEIGRAHV